MADPSPRGCTVVGMNETASTPATEPTLRLKIMCVDGAWVTEYDAITVGAFLRRYAPDLWPDDFKAVRALTIGETYWSGGGASPEWRVVRLG